MKKMLILLLLALSVLLSNAQQKKIDSLKKVLSVTKRDTPRMKVLSSLTLASLYFEPDTSLVYAQQYYELSVKLKDPVNEVNSLRAMATAFSTMGDYAKSLSVFFKVLRMNESAQDEYGALHSCISIGATYNQMKNYDVALLYLKKADKLFDQYASARKLTEGVKKYDIFINNNMGECFMYKGNLDSADFCFTKSFQINQEIKIPDADDYLFGDLGELAARRGNKKVAIGYFNSALSAAKKINNVQVTSITYLSMANLYHKFKQQDSAEVYAKKAFDEAKLGNYKQDALNAGQALSTLYDEDHNLPQAYKYYKTSAAIKDSLFNQVKTRQILSMDFDEKQRQADIAAAQDKYRDKLRTYALLAGLVIVLFVAAVFWRNSNQRKKANEQLQSQKEEIQSALSKLEKTKDQLIQSEKMASLGELTAGIAHEIQNPLNFVNNFSEVSVELLAELKEEAEAGHIGDVIAIADDLAMNLEKIHHHGKRADGIVKGMLEHSRTSTGQKESTDINKLADEYLRLAYHGLRAKDKTFNAELITDFDETLPPANVIPQDIGRVLLNLFNNAFYATQQKVTTAGYEPTVTVTTSAEKGLLSITVKDNGTGIPDHIKDKIMQPFFTTKPTGQGTGLGLSLSYDIIVKGHGGKIDLVTKDGEGSEFIITLPLS